MGTFVFIWQFTVQKLLAVLVLRKEESEKSQNTKVVFGQEEKTIMAVCGMGDPL